MSEEDDFASLLAAADSAPGARVGRRLEAGQIVEAVVLHVTTDTVFVDVGTPGDGRIERAELCDRDGRLLVGTGDRIRASVTDPRADAPRLSAMLGRSAVDRAALELARDGGMPVEGAVVRAVKGGVQVEVGGIRAFCPASQLELGQARPLEEYVGETLAFVVLEISDSERSIVLSRRALLEQQGETAAVPAPDEVLEAKVIKALDHGVLVSTPKGRGLVPVHDLNLAPGADHRRALPVGTMLRVVLLSHDPETGRLRFSASGVSSVEEKRQHREYSERTLAEHGYFGSLGDVLRDKLPKQVHPAPEPQPRSGAVRRRRKKP